jgi:hypothetical protein
MEVKETPPPESLEIIVSGNMLEIRVYLGPCGEDHLMWYSP